MESDTLCGDFVVKLVQNLSGNIIKTGQITKLSHIMET